MRYERFDAGYDIHGERSVVGTWYAVLAYRGADETNEDDSGYLIGIILEAVLTRRNVYRRVGMFTHPWDKVRSAEYPEFADVEDPSKLQREEVIII
jgi:hypothetical protein